MIKNNERDRNQNPMNEKAGACSSPAKQMYSLSSFMRQSPLLIKKQNKSAPGLI
jgi:hypothetical protein